MPKEEKKLEVPEIAEEQSTQESEVAASSAVTTPDEITVSKDAEKEHPILNLLKMIRAQQEERKVELAKTGLKNPAILQAMFDLDSLNDERCLSMMGEFITGVFTLVKENPNEKNKLTLDAIINKGDECPCPKHSGARAAAILIKHKWVGEA
jgi:hypothetical protein